MPIRTRVAALAALTATALAVGATATAQAGAAPNETAQKTASAQKTAAAPRFLAASELPPHPTGWTAGPVTDGFPEQLAYCLGEGVPAYDYRHRLFHTDLMEEFWRAVATHAALTLHIDLLRGNNAHHSLEACAKAAALALHQATRKVGPADIVPSTKGVL